jgi:hypothetical protein
MERIAIVRTSAPTQVAAYLPSNYEVVGITPAGHVVIAGVDKAGWTMNDYVIPRLASGMHIASEVMK